MIPKYSRKIDVALLDFIKEQQCLICHSWPTDPHHITSKGARGGDTVHNVMPLCRTHHREWHDSGRITFVRKYIESQQWLEYHERFDILAKAGIKVG